MSKAVYHLNDHPIPEGFQLYQDRIPVAGLFARKAAGIAFCRGREKRLRFEPDPTNVHDQNAIKVMGSWKGWFSRKEVHLGFVPAEEAATIGKLDLAEKIQPRLLKTYDGTDDFVEIEFQIMGPKDYAKSYKSARRSA